MIAKTNYIKNLALSLNRTNQKMTFSQVAVDLNIHGFVTEYGTSYNGGRGVAKLIHAVYDRLDGQGLNRERDMVANSFTNAQGEYAYY